MTGGRVRAFTIRPDGIVDGITVTKHSATGERVVKLDKYGETYLRVDESTFGAKTSRMYRAQVSKTNALIHDPGVDDNRALLLFDIPKMLRGTTGYGIKENRVEGQFQQFSVSSHFIVVLAQTEGNAPKYLAIVRPNTVVHIRRFRLNNLHQELYVSWDGIYPKITGNKQEIFGPDPFSRFIPEQYELLR